MNDLDKAQIPLGTGILVLLLVILAQYIIAGWVADYGGNADIIGYVSFAGTIVSIILAVLAIVYSYLQTFSQQRDAAVLSSQVHLLRESILNMQGSTATLAEGVTRFSEIRALMDRSIQLGEQSHVAVLSLSKQIESAKNSEGRDPQTATQFTPSKQLRTQLATRAVGTQRAMYLAMIEGGKKRLTTDACFENYILAALNALNKSEDKRYARGFFSATWFMLLDLQVLEIDDMKIQPLPVDFEDALNAAIKAAPTEGEKLWLDEVDLRSIIKAADPE